MRKFAGPKVETTLIGPTWLPADGPSVPIAMYVSFQSFGFSVGRPRPELPTCVPRAGGAGAGAGGAGALPAAAGAPPRAAPPPAGAPPPAPPTRPGGFSCSRAVSLPLASSVTAYEF